MGMLPLNNFASLDSGYLKKITRFFFLIRLSCVKVVTFMTHKH